MYDILDSFCLWGLHRQDRALEGRRVQRGKGSRWRNRSGGRAVPQEGGQKKGVGPEETSSGDLAGLERDKFECLKFEKHLRHPCTMEGVSGYYYWFI